jgi:hypothetical protein
VRGLECCKVTTPHCSDPLHRAMSAPSPKSDFANKRAAGLTLGLCCGSSSIVLVADGTAQNGYTTGLPTKTVPAAPCARGYLIGWVITPASDTPIKFDGLIGEAVVRTDAFAIAGYNAIPIQADPSLAPFAPVSTNGNGALMFDGGAGHYQAVTGQVLGDVRYSGSFNEGFLTLLTLDVKYAVQIEGLSRREAARQLGLTRGQSPR